MTRFPRTSTGITRVRLDLTRATLGAGAVAQKIGDGASALAGAATKVEATEQVPFLADATLEPKNRTVHARKDGGVGYLRATREGRSAVQI